MKLIISLVTVVFVCEGARGQEESHLYEFGLDVGDSVAPTNDDGSVGPLDLDSVFPFYGHTHSSVFVSTVNSILFITVPVLVSPAVP